jgi:hypothetical protein
MSRWANGTEGGAILPGKNSVYGIDGCSGGLPCDISGFRAEHSISLDATTAGGGKPPQLLQVILCMHQQQVSIGCRNDRATSDALQQSRALQVLLKHGDSEGTFRVVPGLVTLKAGI